MSYKVVAADLLRVVQGDPMPYAGPEGDPSYWGFWGGATSGDPDMTRAQYDDTGALVADTTFQVSFDTEFGAAWGSTVQFRTDNLFGDAMTIIRNGDEVVSDGSVVFVVTASSIDTHIVLWDVENGSVAVRTSGPTTGTILALTLPRYDEQTKKLYWFEVVADGGGNYIPRAMRSDLDLGNVTVLGSASPTAIHGSAVRVTVSRTDSIVGRDSIGFTGTIVNRDGAGNPVRNDARTFWWNYAGSLQANSETGASGVTGIPNEAMNDPVSVPAPARSSVKKVTLNSTPGAHVDLWPTSGTWADEIEYRSLSVDAAGLVAAVHDFPSGVLGGRIVRNSIDGPYGGSPSVDIDLDVGPLSLGKPRAAFIRT